MQIGTVIKSMPNDLMIAIETFKKVMNGW